MKEYRIEHSDGQHTIIRCDLEQADAPISVSWAHLADEPEPWSATPFRTADAHHRLKQAAALVLHYTDRESCTEDDEHECNCGARIKAIVVRGSNA